MERRENNKMSENNETPHLPKQPNSVFASDDE